MTMTLDQLRDEMMCTTSTKAMEFYLHERWPAAIDVHIAGMGEPIARVKAGYGLEWTAPSYGMSVKAGDLLYADPPIDIAAVREVIADLTTKGSAGSDYYSADTLQDCINDATDKLTAALPKETP